jgi:hypothetical protein
MYDNSFGFITRNNVIRSQYDQNGCKMLEIMDFTKVVTYIQSGNVFVTTEEENAATVGFKINQEF